MLTSLLPKRVEAQVSGSAPQKSFIGIVAANGLYRMYGPDAELMPRTNPQYSNTDLFQWSSFTGLPGFNYLDQPGRHRIHYAGLTELANANGGKISSLIDASFTPYLPKMTMMQGFNYPWTAFHHRGHFGNANATSGDSGCPPMANIDAVMAWSNTFYKNAARKGRMVNWTCDSRDVGYFGSYYGAGFTWSNPNDKLNSPIVATPAYSNPAALWDAFFGGGGTPSPLKVSLVDSVYADYAALRTNARLGGADRTRLDQHLSLLSETQAKVRSVSAVCGELRPASNLTDRKLILTTINSVIASLISCGLCHSFLGWASAPLNSDLEAYHRWSHEGYANDTSAGGYANAIANQASYDGLVACNRSILRDMCLDLTIKLDQHGLLDNALIACVQEHSRRGHESWNVPVITFGGAGGAINTGQYIDYRDFKSGNDQVFTRDGYPMNQLLANFLRAMDVPATEFEPLNKQPASGVWPFKARSGYGVLKTEFDHYPTQWVGADLSAWLPRFYKEGGA